MNSDFNHYENLTGNHVEVSAITRQRKEERQKIFKNLPQATQEMLVPKPTFFDGSSDTAEDWIQTTKEFASFNQMELPFAFDMLLRGDAKELWQEANTSEDLMTNDKCENWFRLTFINVKSMVEKISDLSSIKQRVDEKYRNFEIRVKKLVKEIFESKRSPDEISRIFILNGLRSEKLKESFALQPELNGENVENWLQTWINL